MAKTARGKAPKKMNAREAIYGLVGFLTTRSKELIFSDKHDCAPIAKLVGAYCDINKLPAMREGWKYQAPLDHLDTTNVKVPQQATNMAPIPPQEVLQRIRAEITSLAPEQQNAVLAKLLQDLKQERVYTQQDAQYKQLQANRDEARAYENLTQFNNITSGNFTILQ